MIPLIMLKYGRSLVRWETWDNWFGELDIPTEFRGPYRRKEVVDWGSYVLRNGWIVGVVTIFQGILVFVLRAIDTLEKKFWTSLTSLDNYIFQGNYMFSFMSFFRALLGSQGLRKCRYNDSWEWYNSTLSRSKK